MLSRVQILIAVCLYYSGLLKLIYWWSRQSRQYLVILNYHRAAGGNLRRHLLYLSRHFRILHLETALEELYTPRKGRLQIGDQRLPLVLTFDDGYYDSSVDAFALNLSATNAMLPRGNLWPAGTTHWERRFISL